MNRKKPYQLLIRLFLLLVVPMLFGLTKPGEYFYSKPTGYIEISGIYGADRKDMTVARRLLLDLEHDSDRFVFERLIGARTVIPLATVASQNDGLRFDLRNVRIVGKSRNSTDAGYTVTLQFSDSHVTCGPPSCMR